MKKIRIAPKILTSYHGGTFEVISRDLSQEMKNRPSLYLVEVQKIFWFIYVVNGEPFWGHWRDYQKP